MASDGLGENSNKVRVMKEVERDSRCVVDKSLVTPPQHTHTSDLTSWSPRFCVIPFLLVWTGPGTSASQQEHAKVVVIIPC